MKKQFQSKSVPRGTRTIWRYLGALFILFTFAIGQMWGTDYVLIKDNNNSSKAALNTTDFWTGQSLQAKSNGGDDYKKCVIMGGNMAGVSAINYPSRYISYDVKTTSVTLTIKVACTNNSAKKIGIYEINEAADGSITSTHKLEPSISKGLQTVEFTATPEAGTRSTIYITAYESSSYLEFYQVIASETGSDLANTKGGRNGYAIDYSIKSRLATKSGETAKLDSVIYYQLTADYKPNSSTSVELKTGKYIKFKTLEPIVLTVVTNSAYKFYVAQTADGTTNERSATATHKIKLATASDWYIIGGASSATKIKSIAFSVPTISYDANGGSSTMSSNTWTVAANGFTAPSGKKFDGWKDADNKVYTVGQEVLEDVTLYAQWKDDVAEYTVTYKDGEQMLKSVNVAVGSAPAAYSPTKDCYTFAAWQKDAVDYDPANLASDAEANTTYTLTARWTPVYASGTYNFEGKSVTTSTTEASVVDGALYFSAVSATLDTGDPLYYGWKLKTPGATVKFLVENNSVVKITLKEKSSLNVTYTPLEGAETTEAAAKSATKTVNVKGGTIVTLTTTTDATTTLNKIEILPLYTATRVDGKSDASGPDANVLETTLPTPTAISGWTFTGWVANQDVKVGEDTKTAGTVLAAGTYTLLANTTFTAQWTEASSTYDVTYTSAHGTAPDAENAASVVLAELSETGWAHKGWTANVDVTVDAATVEAGTLIANGKTVVLASDVTFTAVWKEIFTVTFDAKGGSSVDPVDVEDGASLAAAPADPTKDDYIFLGWSETDGGAVVADITALTITDDKTFYAKWKLDVQVSEIVFSNSFKGWIHDGQVEVFYMAGESAPTIVSYNGKNLKAEGGVVISGDKVIATGTDDSEKEYDLAMTAVTPLTSSGSQTFDGTEGHVKTRHPWTSERKWKMSRYAEDGRVAKGETSMYIFLGAAESVTLDWGAQKVTNDVAVYVNGTFVKNIGKNNNSAIALSNGNNMVAMYSLQTSGDIWLNGLTVAPWVPVTAVALKEGEDAISSKEIWESTSFTLTAEVTPDNASNKTITWTSSNEAVATVENGVVTGVAASADPVTITASTVDGVKATCVVTVKTAPEPSANPVITAQPQSANYYEGATIAELKVLATGESLTYQWYLGSEAIEGAIAATYQPTVSAIGSYVYHCVVTNTEAGNLPTSLATDNATITISEDPACKAIGYGSTRALATNTEVVIDATTGFKHISSVESCETGKKISGETNLTTVKLGGSSAYYDIYTTEMNIGSIALSLTSSSNGEDKRYKYAVIFCKSAEFDASKILGVVEQVGGAGDDAQVINTPEVPLGTKLVRIMRQYTYKETTYGQGNSSYIYYIRACLVEPAQEVSATVLAQPKDTAYCPTEVVEPLSYELSIEDGASAAYQWYKGTEAIENEEAATYTPSETGVYTCKVTLTKTGRLPKEMTSDEATVTFYTATAITGHVDAVGLVDAEKTISVTAVGTSLTYQWQACDVNGTVTDATVLGTAASLNITIASETKYYLATVTGTCDTETQVVEARMWAHHDPAHVTATTTWDWTNAAWSGVTNNIEFANTSVEELMSNVSADVPCLDGVNGFRSDMLYGTGQYVYRPGNKFFQGFKVRFIADVPGIVKVTYRGTGDSKYIILHINDSTYAQYKGGFKTVEALVPAGQVLIEGVGGTDNAGGMTRIQKIEFIADLSGYALADADKTRAVTEGRFGTICMPKGGKVVNGAIFEIAYMDYKDSKPYKIYFDEVVNGLMEPGMPYIFLPNEGAETLGIVSTANKVDDAGHFHGLYGSFTQELLAQNAGNYILQNNQYYYVNSADVYVGANRAYIKLAEVPSYDPGQPAYGRRRVSMNVNAEQVVTDIDNLNAGEQPVKMMIDGKLYILRGEKMFDATGRLVK